MKKQAMRTKPELVTRINSALRIDTTRDGKPDMTVRLIIEATGGSAKRREAIALRLDRVVTDLAEKVLELATEAQR